MSEAKLVDAMAGLALPPFRPILTDAATGPTFTMLGTTMRLIASATATGGRYTVIEQVTRSGWGPQRHIHSREDEIFYILEGSYELHVGDERRTVSAGASAILPRNILHSFRNVWSMPSRLVFVCHSRRTRGVLLGGGKMFASPQSPATGCTGSTVRSDPATARGLTRAKVYQGVIQATRRGSLGFLGNASGRKNSCARGVSPRHFRRRV